MSLDKIVVVTQKTRLEGLLDRFNTRGQAKFWIEHMGTDFADYDREHDTYRRAVDEVCRTAERLERKVQRLERSFLPTFLFAPHDLVVTVGRDGLVVNAAKYVGARPIVAVNPDPARWDGVLLPFTPATARRGLVAALEEKALEKRVTMAQVTLNDGQSLLAFNDFLIGRKDHVSARYAVAWQGRRESQSSSGILVSTGVGSTGWLSSTQNMAECVSRLLSSRAPTLPRLRLGWDDPRLAFVVREPYQSRSSGAAIGAGIIAAGGSLVVESQMPEGGAIFSDGVAEDALAFDSGCVATVAAATRQARLVLDPQAARRPDERHRRSA
jgi:NAD kinase